MRLKSSVVQCQLLKLCLSVYDRYVQVVVQGQRTTTCHLESAIKTLGSLFLADLHLSLGQLVRILKTVICALYTQLYVWGDNLQICSLYIITMFM